MLECEHGVGPSLRPTGAGAFQAQPKLPAAAFHDAGTNLHALVAALPYRIGLMLVLKQRQHSATSCRPLKGSRSRTTLAVASLDVRRKI